MKQFIVLLAALPLMLGLIMQIGLAQSNFTLTARAEGIVRDCREMAAEKGGFTARVRSELGRRLSGVCGGADGIVIIAEDEPDEEGAVRYRVEIPVKKLVAAPRLFGIKPGENSGVYVMEGEIYAHEEEAEKEDKHS
jgi:hypothetical protein